MRPPVPGLIGPYMTEPEIDLAVPSCVKLSTPEDGEALKGFVGQVIKATQKACHQTLSRMLAPTPGAQQLAADFAKRLGLP